MGGKEMGGALHLLDGAVPPSLGGDRAVGRDLLGEWVASSGALAGCVARHEHTVVSKGCMGSRDPACGARTLSLFFL